MRTQRCTADDGSAFAPQSQTTSGRLGREPGCVTGRRRWRTRGLLLRVGSRLSRKPCASRQGAVGSKTPQCKRWYQVRCKMGCWLEVRFDASFLKLVMKCTTALGATVASLGFGCCDGGGRRRGWMFEGRVACCCGCCEEVLGALVGPSVDVLKELRIFSLL